MSGRWWSAVPRPQEAKEALAGIIDRIVLTPVPEGLPGEAPRDSPVLAMSPSVRVVPFGRFCSLARCRLQNVSKTGAELGGLARNLPTSVYLASCCTLGRIDELACVAALLAIWPIENSSPVHPASFLQGSRQLAGVPSCVSRMSPGRPRTSGYLPEEALAKCARPIPCTPGRYKRCLEFGTAAGG